MGLMDRLTDRIRHHDEPVEADSGAVSTLMEQTEQDGSGPPRRVDEERLAVAFVSSHVWQVVNGQIPSTRRRGRRDDAEATDHADALAFAELHKLRNNLGVGNSFGPGGP